MATVKKNKNKLLYFYFFALKAVKIGKYNFWKVT